MTERQPPEPICDHWNYGDYHAGNRCQANVLFTIVTHGPVARMGYRTLPCIGMCPAAKCDKKQLPKIVKPKPKPDDSQGRLF